VPLYPVPNPRPDVTPGGQFITPAGVDAAPPVDLTLSPAATDTAWTGSTPAIQISLMAAPAAATTSWTGSTPTLQRDAAPAPNAATVAWAGTTPAVQVSVTTSPAAASVAWSATTPTLTLTSDRTLTPTVAITAWTGTTPTLVLQSDRTLTPAAGTVAWAGSTPGITGASSLTLTPAAATTAWAGSTPALQLSRVLTPAAATVAWTGSTPTLRRDLTLTPAAPGARTYAGTILATSNVQGYWRLGETTGTTAVDQTGHANGTYLGTITKGTPGLLTGDADKAVALDDAQASRVEITSPPAPTTAVTVEAWAQDTGSTDFYAKIAAKSNSVDAAPFADYCLSANSAADGGPIGRWVMEADINGTHTVLYTNDPVPAGRHHLVGTYDGSVMRLYLDGVEAATPLFVTGTLGNRGQPLEIGRYSPNLALCKFVGTVDEVAVYDRALTAAEVLDHYTLGAQVQNSVVFWQAAAPDVQRDLNRTPAAGTVDVDRQHAEHHGRQRPHPQPEQHHRHLDRLDAERHRRERPDAHPRSRDHRVDRGATRPDPRARPHPGHRRHRVDRHDARPARRPRRHPRPARRRRRRMDRRGGHQRGRGPQPHPPPERCCRPLDRLPAEARAEAPAAARPAPPLPPPPTRTRPRARAATTAAAQRAARPGRGRRRVDGHPAGPDHRQLGPGGRLPAPPAQDQGARGRT
jgi:hypothetical protein